MEMLHGKICIWENLCTGKNIRNSIYSKKVEKPTLYALQREDFPGRGFSWGGGGCIF